MFDCRIIKHAELVASRVHNWQWSRGVLRAHVRLQHEQTAPVWLHNRSWPLHVVQTAPLTSVAFRCAVLRAGAHLCAQQRRAFADEAHMREAVGDEHHGQICARGWV